MWFSVYLKKKSKINQAKSEKLKILKFKMDPLHVLDYFDT